MIRKTYATIFKNIFRSQSIKTDLRNIGIYAHIDAGKTSLSESLLQTTGKINTKGKIDDGTTSLDFIQSERERGITIKSSVISINAKTFNASKDEVKSQSIDLIDTPGHADFTGEVNRSFISVENAVLVLDGVKGVQAQTYSIANKLINFDKNIIIFINKLDREESSFQSSIHSLNQLKMFKSKDQSQLITTVPIQTKANKFAGIQDIPSKLQFINENIYTKLDDIEVNNESIKSITKQSNEFDEFLSNYSNNQLEKQLESEIESQDRIPMLKNLIQNQNIVPVICGSAISDLGVKNLINQIQNYSNESIELINEVDRLQEGFIAVCFKTDANNQIKSFSKTNTSLIKILNGNLNKNTPFNQTNDQGETIKDNKFLTIGKVDGNLFNNVDSLKLGENFAVQKSNQIKPGCILQSRNLKWENVKQFLNNQQDKQDFNLKVEPLIQQKLIMNNNKQATEVQEILNSKMTAEDPTFNVILDDQTKEIRIGGQGELHLEQIRDTLKHKYEYDTKLGDISINYKESITKSSEQEIEHIDKDNQEQFRICIGLKPLCSNQSFVQEGGNIKFNDISQNEKSKILSEFIDNKEDLELESIQKAAHMNDEFHSNLFATLNLSLKQGWMFNFPSFCYDIEILGGHFSSQCTKPALIRKITEECVKMAQLESNPVKVEPSMGIKIICDQSYIEQLLNLADRKRLEIKEVESIEDNSYLELVAGVSKLQGFTVDVRAITHGNAEIEMNPLGQIEHLDNY